MPGDRPDWLDDVMNRFAARHPQLVEMARRIEQGRSVTSRAEDDGHFTASACVIDPHADRVLMTFSSKFRHWLLPGGHIEPDETPFDAALRELEEECGLPPDRVKPRLGRAPVGIDVHIVPARPVRGEPEHLHFDLQFLFELKESFNDFVVDETEIELVEWQQMSKLASYPDLFAAASRRGDV